MHHNLQQSYQSWLSNIGGLQMGAPGCIDPSTPPTAEVAWLASSIDGVIPILARIFKETGAYYLIEEKNGCNARVRAMDSKQARIIVTDGCGEFFLDWANGLHEALLRVVDDPCERALLEMWAAPRQLQNLPALKSIGADAYSSCAITCLLAHELGHMHEHQFHSSFRKGALKDGRRALISHGQEFTADYWSVWTAADIFKPFVDIALKAADRIDQVLACRRLLSTVVLAAFACIEGISLLEEWAPEDPASESTHPAAAARLFNAGLALTDWWLERAGEYDVEAVSGWCVVALQRVLATTQTGHPHSVATDAELLAKLLRRHDESKAYMATVKEVYLSCFPDRAGESEAA